MLQHHFTTGRAGREAFSRGKLGCLHANAGIRLLKNSTVSRADGDFTFICAAARKRVFHFDRNIAPDPALKATADHSMDARNFTLSAFGMLGARITDGGTGVARSQRPDT